MEDQILSIKSLPSCQSCRFLWFVAKRTELHLRSSPFWSLSSMLAGEPGERSDLKVQNLKINLSFSNIWSFLLNYWKIWVFFWLTGTFESFLSKRGCATGTEQSLSSVWKRGRITQVNSWVNFTSAQTKFITVLSVSSSGLENHLNSISWSAWNNRINWIHGKWSILTVKTSHLRFLSGSVELPSSMEKEGGNCFSLTEMSSRKAATSSPSS